MISDHKITEDKKTTSIQTIRSSLFFLLPLTYVIQNPTLLAYEDVASGLKPYHAIAVLLFIFSAINGKANAIIPSIIYIVIIAFAATTNNKYDARIINAIAFIMVFIASSGASITDIRWARHGALLAACIILTITIIQIPTILTSAGENIEGRPLYPTLLAGGINIEVSTLIILLGWTLSNKSLLVGSIALAIFLLTQTRSVFIALPILWIHERYKNKLNTEDESIKKSSNFWWKLLIILVCLSAISATDVIDIENITQRIANSFGDEPGSEGRILLYSVALSASSCFLMGCGLGSASEIISNSIIANFFEDNFHNVFLQQLIELGIAGLATYSWIFIAAFLRSKNNKDFSGITVAISIIYFMSFIQFNGFEILTAFILGLANSDASKNTHDNNLRESI